jgi:hypothetical protein
MNNDIQLTVDDNNVRFSSNDKCPFCDEPSWYSTDDDPIIRLSSGERTRRFEIMIPQSTFRREVRKNLKYVCFNCGKSETKQDRPARNGTNSGTITLLRFKEYFNCVPYFNARA